MYMENLIGDNNVLAFVMSFLSSVVVAYITAKLTLSNSRKSITAEHFKQQSIELQKINLEFWSSMLSSEISTAIKKYKIDLLKLNNDKNINTKIKEIENKKYGEEELKEMLKELQLNSYLYGSYSTIKAMGTYQQFAYKGINKEDNKKSNWKTMKTLTMVSRIISKMKYDYTGEKTSVMDILRIRINDFDFKKEIIGYLWSICFYIKERYVSILLAIIIILLIIFGTIIVI